mgnify:CR=1 FL=1
MTPEEFSAKLAAGDQLLVTQVAYKQIRFHTGQGTNRDGRVLGLLADAALAQTLVDINGKYTTDDVLFAYFEDPDEAEPRTGVYMAAAKVAEPIASVATIDDTLAAQLAALTAQQIADVVSAFTPDTPTPA